EHTSSSKGNGDHYAPGTGGEATGFPSSRQRQRPEPHGSSRTSAAAAATGNGAAAGGRGSYHHHHQSVATPPREREDAAPLWGDSGGHGGANGTGKARQTAGKLSAYSEPVPAAAAAAAAGRPDSNSPERVAAPGFDRRRRENGIGNGVAVVGGVGRGGDGMAAGEGDEWDVPHTATAYTSSSRQDESAFLSTPDSRGARANASGGGGGGSVHGGRGVNGYDEDRSGFSSPSRAPRKQAAHSGGGFSAGPRAAG
ncbi:unnamed protein product, partial [Scytosiphon promiscuus]